MDWDRSLARTVSSNPDGGMSLVSVFVLSRRDPVKGRSLVQRSPNECGVSERVLETSAMISTRTTRLSKHNIYIYMYILLPWRSRSSGCSRIYKDVSLLSFCLLPRQY